MSTKSTLILMAAGALLLSFALNLRFAPVGVDYLHHFDPAAERFWTGEPLYTAGFFNAPWLVWLLTPFHALRLEGGNAALLMFSLAVMLTAWRQFSTPDAGLARPWALAIVIFNLHAFDFLLRVQIDGFILLGVLMMYRGMRSDAPGWLGLGWVLAAIRPTSMYLLFPFTLWRAYQRGFALRAFIVPALTLLLSFIIHGPDWPLDWFRFITTEESPQPLWITTWWRMAEYLEWPLIIPAVITLASLAVTGWVFWQTDDLRTRFVYLVVASLVTTPYALSYHYAAMMLVFVPFILEKHLWLGIPLYALTLLPILRIGGAEVAWVDVFLPFSVWVWLSFWIVRTRPFTTPAPAAKIGVWQKPSS